MAKCLCCGRELSTSRCAYCGLREVIALDDSGLRKSQIDADAYKESLISKITDIRLQAYEYDDNLNYKGTSAVRIADGKTCFGRYVSCAETFQGVDNAAVIAKPRVITLLYKFDGKERKTTCTIRLPKCKDNWTFEAKLCENPTFSIRTGTKSIHTEQDNISLDLT